MHIALIVPGGVDRSGDHRVIPALIALIARLSVRHDVQVFALRQEVDPGEWELAGAHIHNIGSGSTVVRAVRTIRRLHRAKAFEVVHSIWSGWGGLVAVTVAKLLGIPSLIHVTGGELVSIPQIGYGGRRTWRGRMREAWTLRSTDLITVPSAPILDLVSDMGLRAQRVPLGVDLAAWPPRQPVRRDPARRARLIHVASLNSVKDQTTLLRALASLSRSGVDFELEIIGEDLLQGCIQSMSARLGLADKIGFHGFLPQRQLRPLVEAADLMILSSRHEAGPFVMLEAAVAGVPSVGTAVGHLHEWSPEAASSVPVGDWARLAEAIKRVLDDEDLRLRMARNALQRAMHEDADHTAECFQALYAALL